MSERLEDEGSFSSALITFAPPDLAAAYHDAHDLAMPILGDPERTVYRSYGLERGAVARVWGWATLRRYAAIMRTEKVRLLHRPTDDTLQLGGDFIVAPDGSLAWGHWSQGPADRPTIETIMTNLRRAADQSDDPR